jgi:hypothetical protein
MDVLKINIQKRHVIGHNLGVIDDKFVPFDPDAKVGEEALPRKPQLGLYRQGHYPHACVSIH